MFGGGSRLGMLSPGTHAGRWLGFVTAVWVQMISGNNYTFSNYSHALKMLMGLNQVQLNELSVAKDVGKAFGLLAGLASDSIPTYVILLVGSLEGLVGYGAQWLVVSRTIRPLPYWLMCVFLCMGGNSTTWMNTAVLVTCIRNFHRNRGPVSGILKGYVGLSTAIFTDLCAALFNDSPSFFLLMLAIVPLVVCLAAMFFLYEIPDDHRNATKDDLHQQDKDDTRYLSFFSVVAIVIAFYLLSYDMFGRQYFSTMEIGKGELFHRAFAVGLLVLIAVPIGVPIYTTVYHRQSAPTPPTASSILSPSSSLRDPLLPEEDDRRQQQVEKADAQESIVVRGRPEIGEDHSIMQVVVTLEFWVLFVSFLCGVGTGLAVQNNLGQIGVAMGYAEVSIFVSMFSIFGFFGRIGAGTISEYFIKRSATPRPTWNAASQVLMAVGYVLMAFAFPGSLYLGSIIVGLCYGIRLAITVPTASELFGLKYYGLIYNILILNLPFGSFLFSGLLAGILYDAQATRSPDGGNTCVGAHCYKLVFLIMCFACVLGFVLDIVLAVRTKALYRKICISKGTKKEAASDHGKS